MKLDIFSELQVARAAREVDAQALVRDTVEQASGRCAGLRLLVVGGASQLRGLQRELGAGDDPGTALPAHRAHPAPATP